MKKIVVLLLGALFFGACSSYSAFNDPVAIDEDGNLVLVQDSVEHELIILDIDFENWFATRNMISTAHTDSYYKNRNLRYVSEWNRLYLLGHPSFDSYIDYSPFEDYGLEINYKLYHYFRFVEEKTGIRLVYR